MPLIKVGKAKTGAGFPGKRRNNFDYHGTIN